MGLVVFRSLHVSFESQGASELGKDTYICSVSGRTIVYKGMVRSVVLEQFYQDLTDDRSGLMTWSRSSRPDSANSGRRRG